MSFRLFFRRISPKLPLHRDLYAFILPLRPFSSPDAIYIPLTHTGKPESPPVAITLSYLHMCGVAIYFISMTYKTMRNSALIRFLASGSQPLAQVDTIETPQVEFDPRSETPLGWSDFVLWVLFEGMAGCTLLVLLVYWTLLAPSSDNATNFGSFSMHLCTFLAMTTEIILSRQKIMALHIVFALGLVAIFYTDMGVYYSITGRFIYNFFSWKDDKVMGIIFWIFAPVGYAVMYFLMLGLSRIRERCLEPPGKNQNNGLALQSTGDQTTSFDSKHSQADENEARQLEAGTVGNLGHRSSSGPLKYHINTPSNA